MPSIGRLFLGTLGTALVRFPRRILACICPRNFLPRSRHSRLALFLLTLTICGVIFQRRVLERSMDNDDDGIVVRGPARLKIIGGMPIPRENDTLTSPRTSKSRSVLSSKEVQADKNHAIHIDQEAVQLFRRSWAQHQRARNNNQSLSPIQHPHNEAATDNDSTQSKSESKRHAPSTSIRTITSNESIPLPFNDGQKKRGSFNRSQNNATKHRLISRLDVENMQSCIHYDWLHTMKNEKFFDAMSQLSRSIEHALVTRREGCISEIVTTYCTHKNSTLYDYSQMLNTTSSCDAAHGGAWPSHGVTGGKVKVPHLNSRRLMTLQGNHTKTQKTSFLAHAPRSSKLVFVLALSSRAFVQQVKSILRTLLLGQSTGTRSNVALILIHVDKGHASDYLREEMSVLAQRSEDAAAHTPIRVLPKSFDTTWGGSGLMDMYAACMEYAFSWEWDHLINLSEQDFPTTTSSYVAAQLGKHLGKSFMTGNPRPAESTRERLIKKQAAQWTSVQCERFMFRLAQRDVPKQMRFVVGSDWFIVSRGYAEYVTGSDPYVVAMRAFFRHSILSAESYMHTLAANSPWCNTVVWENHHFEHWVRGKGCHCTKEYVDWCGCSPLSIRAEIMRSVLAYRTENWFARKFDPRVDMRGLTALRRIIEKDVQAVAGAAVKASAGRRAEHLYWANVFHKSDVGRASPMGVLSFARLAALALNGTTNIVPPELHTWHAPVAGTLAQNADTFENNTTTGAMALQHSCGRALRIRHNGHAAFGLDHVHELYSDGTVAILPAHDGQTRTAPPPQFLPGTQATGSRNIGAVARVQTSLGQCEMLFAPAQRLATALQEQLASAPEFVQLATLDIGGTWNEKISAFQNDGPVFQGATDALGVRFRWGAHPMLEGNRTFIGCFQNGGDGHPAWARHHMPNVTLGQCTQIAARRGHHYLAMEFSERFHGGHRANCATFKSLGDIGYIAPQTAKRTAWGHSDPVPMAFMSRGTLRQRECLFGSKLLGRKHKAAVYSADTARFQSVGTRVVVQLENSFGRVAHSTEIPVRVTQTESSVSFPLLDATDQADPGLWWVNITVVAGLQPTLNRFRTREHYNIRQRIFFAPTTFEQTDGWKGLEDMWDVHGICVRAPGDAPHSDIDPETHEVLRRCRELLPSCAVTPWSPLQDGADVTGID
eukprot:m.610470 g.610470  ORF g.610470 m.610470 type:complete len:1166 (+) comp22494_c0_seq17:163-3660(+)